MAFYIQGYAKHTFMAVLLLLSAGCANYGVIKNTQKVQGVERQGNYSLRGKDPTSTNSVVVLAFSGGGTRAAALAYGVLLELRDTKLSKDGKSMRALDGIDTISSVSGGSFTAMYYGLYGDRIFEDYEKEFLRVNIEGRLIRRMYFNPLQWWNRAGRTEQAVRYYNRHIFHDATYADLTEKDGPLILINASDLGHGVRFSFVQDYFDLFNSDIATFPVARAVTASSAVPVLFDPIVVQNYPGEREKEKPEWLTRIQSAATLGNNAQLEMVTHGISGYFDRSDNEYIHFVDGGITDNLGLRAVHDIVEMSGGINAFYSSNGRTPPERLILISVNASAKRETDMDKSNKQPSIKATMGAVTSIQMHRYNIATINLMQESWVKWAQMLSTPERKVEPYFIQVRFDDVKDEAERDFLNTIPTSFNLTEEQVDALIKAGRELLRENPVFKKMLSDADLEVELITDGSVSAGSQGRSQ